MRLLLGFLCLSATPIWAEPVFSIAGTLPQNGDYNQVLQGLDDAGADATSIALFWDELEKDGHYAPNADWPTIANLVYPARDIQVELMISVVDTVADRRPADLQSLPFDDPRVIERFDAFLTQVLLRMPDVTLTGIGIGNEVDGVLAGDDWAAYGRFFIAAKATAHRLRPDVPVGMTLTWSGLQGPQGSQARLLADLGDVWMVNHYPLLPGFEVDRADKIPGTIDAILSAAGDKTVFLTELGYPSGGCGGSEAGQTEFVRLALAHTADNPRLGLVTLVWMHDLSPAEVATYARYYGVSGNCFAGYLATLGLRTHDGVDKPAFAWLRSR
jgi:hypothetical protein